MISDSDLTTPLCYHTHQISSNHLVHLNRVINQVVTLNRNCAFPLKNEEFATSSQHSVCFYSPSSLIKIRAYNVCNDVVHHHQAIPSTDSDDNKYDNWQQPIEDELLDISDDVLYIR